MKSRLLFTSAGLLALLAMPVGSVAQGQNSRLPRYTVTDLGTLGGTYSYAYGLNDAGVVAGGSATPIQTGGLSQTGFLWYGGHMIDLGTLDGAACPDCSSEAGGPNAVGESALFSETSTIDPNGEDFCGFGTHRQCLGAIWKKGELTALPTLPGGNNAQTYWLNNRGQVVGFSENGTRDPTCAIATPFQVLRFEPVIWAPNGEIRELSPLAGDTVAFGFGINDKGQAVGSSGLCSNTSLPPTPSGVHAVLWESDGSVHDLGNLGGTAPNVATSINNRGEVVGNAALADGSTHPYLWTKQTGMQDLGLLPGDIVTVPPCCHTLNDRDQVVGFSFPGPRGSGRAFLWQNGVMTDLNTLIPASSPLYLLQALSINDAGEIVGVGVNSMGDVHAFRATPCYENAADSEWCNGDGESAAAKAEEATKRLKLPLPANVRKLLEQRLQFNEFGLPLARPR